MANYYYFCHTAVHNTGQQLEIIVFSIGHNNPTQLVTNADTRPKNNCQAHYKS